MSFIGIIESILAGLLLAVAGFFLKLYLERVNTAHRLTAHNAVAVSKEDVALNVEDLVVSAQGSIRIKIKTQDLDAGLLGAIYRKSYESIEGPGFFIPMIPVLFLIIPFGAALGLAQNFKILGWDLLVYLLLVVPLLSFLFYLWKSFMEFMLRFSLTERVIHVYGDSIMTQRVEYLDVGEVAVFVSNGGSFLQRLLNGFSVQLKIDFGKDREASIIYSNWLSSHVLTTELLEQIASELQKLIEDAQSRLK